jgi:hypothetical protein
VRCYPGNDDPAHGAKYRRSQRLERVVWTRSSPIGTEASQTRAPFADIVDAEGGGMMPTPTLGRGWGSKRAARSAAGVVMRDWAR